MSKAISRPFVSANKGQQCENVTHLPKSYLSPREAPELILTSPRLRKNASSAKLNGVTASICIPCPGETSAKFACIWDSLKDAAESKARVCEFPILAQGLKE